MPLRRGKKHMGSNYRELRRAGKSKKQAQAIMLKTAFGPRKQKRRRQ